jgi:hypothetical protein
MLEYLVQNEPFKVAQGGMHFRNGGSSMASPVVAGIAALYLEQCPEADWQDFKEAVINAAAIDGYTGDVPNRYWGHGKVNGFGTIAFDAIELEVIQEGDELIASGGDSYQWYLNSDLLNGETGSVLGILGSGSYSVEAFNDAGCSVFSEPVLVTSLNSYTLPKFRIVPNPASRYFTVSGGERIDELMIKDSYGKTVKSISIPSSGNIDISDLSPGLYLLEIHTEGSIQIKKLIIE